jgi:hypothetical protein
MITIHKDTVATNSAATPEDTRSSARHTPPFPIANKSNPVTVVLRHSAQVGLAFVFHNKIGNAISPKTKWRIPATINGGKDSSPTRIARNVDPQMT